MSQRLKLRVAEVQRSAQRLRWRYGLARLAIVAIGSLAAFGLLDFLVRPQIPTVRWLFSIGLAALWAWAFARLALPSLVARENLVAVAERIDERYHQLNRQLSSAIAFLTQPCAGPAAGSLTLRSAAVADTEALAEGLDFRSALDGRQAARATAIAGMALAAAALFAILAPATAGLAVQRLLMPWHQADWPRNHELVLVMSPQRLAWGDDFEVAVIDRRGKLPDSVQLLLRYLLADGTRLETIELRPQGERLVHRQEKVTRGFEYRVEGGDDDTMPWTRLTIIEPPKLLELTVQVQPPVYTGLPPRTEGRVVKALVGSRVRIQGRFERPIQRAFIHSETPQLAAPSVAISSDGLAFIAPADGSEWIVDRSGVLSLSFIDKEGLAFGRDTRVELQAVPDSPPVIVWEAPADEARVTARAIVSLRGAVTDDLAVERVQLRHFRSGGSDAEDEEVVELRVASDTTLARPGDDVCVFDSRLDLSRLPGLAPGDVLLLRIQAEDRKPQIVSPPARRLMVISAEELQSRVVARQAEILEQLMEALRSQRQLREQTRQFETGLQGKRFEAGALNALEAQVHRQRQVQQLLGKHTTGAEGQLRALLDELVTNRREEEALAQRLGELLLLTRTINEDLLPAVEQRLTDVVKTVQGTIEAGSSAARLPDNVSAALAEEMRAAAREQEAVTDALEQMVGTLVEQDNLARTAEELRQIAAEQSQLIDLTDKLHLRAVTMAVDLAPAERAPVRQLAERQSELARRFDEWQTRLEELPLPRSANAEGFFAEALIAARRLAIGGQMREAATQLGRLRFGQALDGERRAFKSLKRLEELLLPQQRADAWSDRDAILARRVELLATRQEAIVAEVPRLDATRDSGGRLPAEDEQHLADVGEQQRTLMVETEELRSNVGHAQVLDLALAEAAGRMRRATALLAQGQTAAESQDAVRRAHIRLGQVLAALRPDHEPADKPAAQDEGPEHPLLKPELAGMAAELRMLKLLQEDINDRTIALEAHSATDPVRVAQQQQDQAALAREQGRLAEIMEGLLKRVSKPSEP